MILNRRKLIGGIGLLVAAPAIVKASSLMPVRSYPASFDAYGVTSFQSVTWYRLRVEPLTWAQGVDCWNWVQANSLSPTAAGESAA